MADTNKVASAEPVAWDGRGKCDCSDDTGLCPRCFPDYPTEPPAQPPAEQKGGA